MTSMIPRNGYWVKLCVGPLQEGNTSVGSLGDWYETRLFLCLLTGGSGRTRDLTFMLLCVCVCRIKCVHLWQISCVSCVFTSGFLRVYDTMCARCACGVITPAFTPPNYVFHNGFWGIMLSPPGPQGPTVTFSGTHTFWLPYNCVCVFSSSEMTQH